MKRLPVVIQHDTTDCGVACIAMVCSWYSINLSLSELKEQCVPTMEGVSLKSIANTLENFGFRAIGGRITTTALIEKVTLPVILHWHQNHFVVLFKITRKKSGVLFHIADPATGPVIYSLEEFEREWISTRTLHEDKGVALLIYKQENGIVYNHDKSDKQHATHIFSTILPYFREYKWFFFTVIFGYACLSLSQLIVPYLTKTIVDVGIASKDIHFIIIVLVAQLALLLGTTSARWVNNWIILHISTRISLSLVSNFLIKLMKLPIAFFDQTKVGDIIQRIGDHGRIESFITSQSLSLLYHIITFLVFGFAILTYSVNIFIVFLCFSAAYFIWLITFMKKRKELDYKFFRINADNNNTIYRLIHGMQEAKLQNTTQEQRWKWEDIRSNLFEANIAQMKLSQKQQIGGIFITESKNIVITVLTASLVIQNEITLGIMLAIQFIIGQLSVPVSQIANYIYSIQDVKISLERINDIKQKKDENHNRTQLLYKRENSITIDGLYFRYNGSNSDVLKDINIHIRQGQTVAIVGESGCGKTTLLKLILQYYEPQQGSIAIGGQNLKNVKVQSIWDKCGVVMQDGYIFSDSIAKNIAATSDEIDTARLLNAAKMAMIDSFIQSLPLGYNTIIGDEGRNLSSGQKQRILIARAIYKDADFLFFDEATNSLDATNEKQILENIHEFIRSNTAIIIAHRLSTVQRADKIIVLHNGSIVEEGTHNDLLAMHGHYYQLIKHQLKTRI